MKRQHLNLLVKTIVTLTILGYLFTRVDWDATRLEQVFTSLNLSLYLLSFTGVILVLGLKSIRWNVLLRHENCMYSYWSAFSAYMASMTIGLITPARVGEIARLYYVRGETEINFSSSFKTIIADRILDFAILVWFGTSGIFYLYRLLGNIHAIWYLVLIGIIMMVLWLTVLAIMRVIKPANRLLVIFNTAWNEMFQIKMVVPWLLTFIAYLIFYMANWLILVSLGEYLSISDMGFILSLMSLAILIPVTLAGFGTREVSLIFLLGFYGISPETAIVFSLLQFVAFFLWGGLIGSVFWIIKPVKLSLIVSDAKKIIGYKSKI